MIILLPANKVDFNILGVSKTKPIFEIKCQVTL